LRSAGEAAPSQLDSFLRDPGRSPNDRSNRLAALRRREEALAAVNEALTLVVPPLEHTPYRLPVAPARLSGLIGAGRPLSAQYVADEFGVMPGALAVTERELARALRLARYARRPAP
jgi:hypothetical protein